MGYGLAALAWLALAALLALRGHARGFGALVLAAIAVQASWALACAASPRLVPTTVASVLEALRPFGWTVVLLGLIGAARRREPLTPISMVPARATARALTDGAAGMPTAGTAVPPAAATIAAAAGDDGPPGSDDSARDGADRGADRGAGAWSRAVAQHNLALTLGIALAAALAAAQGASALGGAGAMTAHAVATLPAVLGLICCARVLRDTRERSRWAVKFLCLAMASAFAFDLALHADAALSGLRDQAWWAARGFAHAMLAPMVAIAASRMPDWRLDLRLSRKVVVHATTMVVGAVFLVVMIALGYGLRALDTNWGSVAQALLLFAALLFGAVLTLSSSARAKVRVTLVKHLFSYRYDYRTEWLKLTGLLAHSARHEGSLALRAIQGLGDLVETQAGALWLRSDDGDWRCAATRSVAVRPALAGDDPLPQWLGRRQWIVELAEWRAQPDRYDHLPLPTWLASDPDSWLIVPLVLNDALVGFVELRSPVVSIPLDWEIRDVLKTAGRQVAGVLAVEQAVERLIQARQFESFNRMSAFVVHDLKNLVAQLTLLLRNADRHRDNPDFQADMLETVENVLDRMQGLLLQLRVGTRPVEPPAPTPFGAVLRAAVAGKRGSRVEPVLSMTEAVERALVVAHPDRLERVIGHLVQNAIEATGADGTVRVAARVRDDAVVVDVTDTGGGMSASFLQNRLFKPFTSTKEHGMGIGAFESREYVREIGGRLEVTSVEGRGTTFTLHLPVHGGPSTASGER